MAEDKKALEKRLNKADQKIKTLTTSLALFFLVVVGLFGYTLKNGPVGQGGNVADLLLQVEELSTKIKELETINEKEALSKNGLSVLNTLQVRRIELLNSKGEMRGFVGESDESTAQHSIILFDDKGANRVELSANNQGASALYLRDTSEKVRFAAQAVNEKTLLGLADSNGVFRRDDSIEDKVVQSNWRDENGVIRIFSRSSLSESVIAASDAKGIGRIDMLLSGDVGSIGLRNSQGVRKVSVMDTVQGPVLRFLDDQSRSRAEFGFGDDKRVGLVIKDDQNRDEIKLLNSGNLPVLSFSKDGKLLSEFSAAASIVYDSTSEGVIRYAAGNLSDSKVGIIVADNSGSLRSEMFADSSENTSMIRFRDSTATVKAGTAVLPDGSVQSL